MDVFTPLKPSSDQNDYRDILQRMGKKHFQPNRSLERQIASFVRELIQKKKLVPQTRLPPIRMLCELWNTNYFTVQAALRRLGAEGLIVQSTSKGSFVAESKRELHRVCLYHERNLESNWQEDFYTRLSMSLYFALSERGIISVPFFDHRPQEEQNTAPPEVRAMVRDGEIDAIIGTTINYSKTRWLTKVGVPNASLVIRLPHRIINFDMELFVQLTLEEVLKRGHKTVGLIHIPTPIKRTGPSSDPLLYALKKIAEEKNIKVVVPKKPPMGDFNWEDTGSYLCEKILRSKVPVESIVIYPDSLIYGVAQTLLKHQITVPENLQVISHRNFESSFWVPFPVTWLTVKIEDYARGLLKQIDQQIAGVEMEPINIPVHLESPPSLESRKSE
jgi:DNA-binding LacI/PurR family transcriptional regulator/DNA-binding transcriptional regulator YhcF (GntR family)